MAQIKAQQVNWLDEAWKLSAAISEMPTFRPAGLLGVLPSGHWPLGPNCKRWIELLQDQIALHLAYRLRVKYKIKAKLRDGTAGMLIFEDRNPAKTLKAYQWLDSIGVKFTTDDLYAIEAHAKVGRILIDRYVCDEWKRQLPLIVASIGGATASQAAGIRATQPRTRRNELQDAKARALASDPDATWKQLLETLMESEGIVTAWDDSIIKWNDERGDAKTTKTKTFLNWKTPK